MKTIQLTNSNIRALVSNKDYSKCRKKNWYLTAKGYVRSTDSQAILLHIFIIEIIPIGFQIDHENGIRHDCQRKNLRIATSAQNAQNSKRKSNGTSKYKGVSIYRQSNKWRVNLFVNGRNKSFGLYTNEIQAARVYDIWAKFHYGKFAKTNF